jgi:hypothetical protein
MKVRKLGGLFGLCVVAATIVGGAGCSEDASADVSGEVTARVSSGLTAGSIKSINGTYTNCVTKTGSWSVLVTGSDPLTNPVLGVVMNDLNCQLAITSIVADQVYTASPALALSATYAGAASTFTAGGGGSFTANAKLSSATFASNFDITLVHSDDPTTADGGTATGTYATVSVTTVNALIPAPDYTLSLTSGTPLTIQMDASKNVVSVSGSATLAFGAYQGTQYIIDRGTLNVGIVLADITTAWATEALAGRVYSVTANQNTSIPAANFALTSLSSNVTRTVIVARTVGAVTAYQVFRVTFKGS